MRDLLGEGAWVTLSFVMAPVLVYLDRLVLAEVLSLAACARYVAIQDVVQRALVVPKAIAQIWLPRFAAYSGNGTDERASMRKASLFLTWGWGTGLVVLALTAGEWVKLWLGRGYWPEAEQLVGILILAVFINGHAHLPFVYLQATGRSRIPAILNCLEVPLAVILMVVLSRSIGLQGAAWGWVVIVTFDLFCLSYAASRIPRKPGYVCAQLGMLLVILLLGWNATQ